MRKVVVITGGTGGLGKAVCRIFLDADYNVVTTYRSDEELKDVLEFTADKASLLSAFRVDVTDESSLDELVRHLEKKHGYLTHLVCLVGGFTPGTLGEAAGERLEKMIDLNVRSFALSCNALVPLIKKTLRDKKYRSLVQTGSIIGIAAKPALESLTGNGLYAASKSALVSLVKILAKELSSERITVNAVAPSTIDTAANRKAMPKADFETWVKPELIGQTIFFLGENPAISGAIVPIYGKG